MRLKPKHERERTLAEIQTELRGKLREHPRRAADDHRASASIFGGFGQPIQINVQGPEATRLKLAAEQVLEAMRAMPGVAEPNVERGGRDPAARRARRPAAGVGGGPRHRQRSRPRCSRCSPGSARREWEDPQGYSHDVVVVYPDSLRASAADVSRTSRCRAPNVDPRTGQPAMVPLSQVADVRAGVGPQQIERRQLERQVSALRRRAARLRDG